MNTPVGLDLPGLGSSPRLTPREKRSRRGRMGWLAMFLFLLASLAISWHGRSELSGRIRETFPGDRVYRPMPLSGQCHLQAQEPVFYEDVAFLHQEAFFSGWRDARVQSYITRALPALLASFVMPVVGLAGASRFVNWLAWALCAWTTWRLSKKLFADDLSALLSVLFVSGGMGMVFHIDDWSAHLPAFACYYLGVYLLYDSGVLFEPKLWRTHLLLGAFLALVSLVYSFTAAVLLAVYVLSAFRHNRWLCLAGAVTLALTALPAWKITVKLLGFRGDSVELEHGTGMLLGWLELLKHPSAGIALVRHALKMVGFFDSPGIMILGILCCVLLPRTRAVRWFGLWVLVMPFAAAFALFPFTDTLRGYLTYGITIWLYCWLGHGFATSLRGGTWLRLAAGLTLGLVVATHFAWSTAHFWGWLGPGKAFIEGWEIARGYFVHPRASILSLTGWEQTPLLFGGDTSLAAAGAYGVPFEVNIDPDSVSWWRALGTRGLHFFYLALFGILAVRSLHRRMLVIGGLVCLALVTSLWSWLAFRTMPNSFETVVDAMGSWSEEVSLSPSATLTYRAQLSPAVLDRLRTEMEPQDQLQFFVGLPSIFLWGTPADQSGIEIEIAAGQTSLATRNKEGICLALDPQAALAPLSEAGQVTVQVTNHLDRTVRFAGWQRADLPGRQCLIRSKGRGDHPIPVRLPAIEIRLLRPDGSLKVAAF